MYSKKNPTFWKVKLQTARRPFSLPGHLGSCSWWGTYGRKLVAAKKRKESLESTDWRLRLVTESGKCVLGRRPTLTVTRRGKERGVTLANHCPALRTSEVEYQAALAQPGVRHRRTGHSVWTVTRQSVCTAVVNPGDPAIPSSTPGHTGGKDILQHCSSVKGASAWLK